MTATAHHPAAAAYEAQLRIRQEGEERNNAQQDLNSWLSELKLGKNEPPCVKAVAKKTKAPSPAEAMLVVTNEPISVEDERLRGNKFFSQGKYQDAVNCYTRCLGDKEAMTSPVVYSNRAMAFIKLKKWSNAEADCTLALDIDPKHSKSYQRRCVARLSLGKLRAAMMDACNAEDYLGNDEKTLCEIRELQQKVHRALMDAVKRAPRKKINVEVINA